MGCYGCGLINMEKDHYATSVGLVKTKTHDSRPICDTWLMTWLFSESFKVLKHNDFSRLVHLINGWIFNMLQDFGS